MHKAIFKIVIFLLLAQCGYTTVYKYTQDNDIKIVITNFKGDKEFNNKLNSALREYFNTNTKNEFKIDVSSELSRKIISKDAKGKVANFELEATTTFNIKHNQKDFSITLNELLNVENVDDSFKQKKYETIIKRNFAESMKEKLILKLNTL